MIFSTTFVCNISQSKKTSARSHNELYIGLHAKYPLFLSQILTNLKFSLHIFEKYSKIKFHENPSWGGTTSPFKRTDGQTSRR